MQEAFFQSGHFLNIGWTVPKFFVGLMIFKNEGGDMKPMLGFLFGLTLMSLMACGGDSENNGDAACTGANRCIPKVTPFVDWEMVPQKFNPAIKGQEFSLANLRTINMSFLGFVKDARVQYSNDMPSGRGRVEVYSVTHNNPGNSLPVPTVELKSDSAYATYKIYGSFSHVCNIDVTNLYINNLEGACIVRLVVTLPRGAEIEVYNMGEIISRRFFAMTVNELKNKVKKAYSQDDKADMINEYLVSHASINKVPVLYTFDLGILIDEFRFDGKFIPLRRLHMYVKDRHMLESMIEDKYSYFDQEEAKKIVGIQ